MYSARSERKWKAKEVKWADDNGYSWETMQKVGICRSGVRSSGPSMSQEWERYSGDGGDSQERDGELVAGWVHLSREWHVSEEDT